MVPSASGLRNKTGWLECLRPRRLPGWDGNSSANFDSGSGGGQGEDVTVAASSAAANGSCIVSGLSGGRWRARHFTLVRIRPSEVSIAVSHGLCGGEIRRAGSVACAVSSGGGHGRDGTAVAVAVAVLRLQVSLLLNPFPLFTSFLLPTLLTRIGVITTGVIGCVRWCQWRRPGAGIDCGGGTGISEQHAAAAGGIACWLAFVD